MARWRLSSSIRVSCFRFSCFTGPAPRCSPVGPLPASSFSLEYRNKHPRCSLSPVFPGRCRHPGLLGSVRHGRVFGSGPQLLDDGLDFSQTSLPSFPSPPSPPSHSRSTRCMSGSEAGIASSWRTSTTAASHAPIANCKPVCTRLDFQYPS